MNSLSHTSAKTTDHDTVGMGGIPSANAEIIQEYPLSYGQRALWFVQKLNPETAAHNVAHSGRLLLTLDPSLLRDVFQEIVDRHPALRTTFSERNGEPRQRVHASQEVSFRHVDVSTWEKHTVHAQIREEMYRPFDLGRGPLFRVTLLTEAPRSHILLLVLHHAITDLWSCALILNEFSALYMERVTGQAIPLPAAFAPFHEVIAKETAILAGPEGERLWQFWQSYLGGDLVSLQLHTDRPRPRIPSHRGSTESIRLSPALSAEVKRLSKAQKAMTHVTVLAVYAALLHRYTGQTDILIGTPKAIRNRATANTLGYLINPLPLRFDCSGDPTFVAFLRHVRDSVSEVFAHGAFPFPLLVERLHLPRDPSRSPLFQVMFSWQKTIGIIDSDYMTAVALAEESHGHDLNGMPVGGFEQQELPVPFDLTLMAAETSTGEIVLTLEFNLDLFERTTVLRTLQDLKALFAEIAGAPDRRLSQFRLLAEEDTRQALSLWSASHTTEPCMPLLPAILKQCAEEHPAAPAIAAGPDVMTYADLQLRTNQLARYLQEHGIGPEVSVGVFLERSQDLIVSILAVLKAGGVYVPIDPAFPRDRISFMLKDTGAPVVITRSSLRALLPAEAQLCVCLDDHALAIARMDPTEPDPGVDDNNGAYVIYTSGSTGLPKGVMIAHRALTNHCRDMQRYYGLHPTDSVLQFASPNFDASLEQILPTLMTGATLVLRDEELWSPREFLRKLEEYQVSVINLPPAYWHQIAQELRTAGTAVRIPHLRLVIIGGDVMREESLRLWNEAFGGTARLLNAYGPTETTITALTHEIPQDGSESYPWMRVPIGRPLAHRRMYILDRHMNPLPSGVPGELYLAGAGIARGYLGRPELTAERFLPDPFSLHTGARMYRTGDLVTYRPDGVVEFHGRIDQQVKIRGFRVELEEIEATIARLPDVAEVAVITHQTPDGETEIAAYAVGRTDRLDSDAIRSWCSQRLPAYMVPGTIMVLASFPHTPGGKIDRRALPSPGPRSVPEGGSGAPPTTPIEREVAALWEQLLNIPGVGVHDDFFQLGGHSLLATQLATRLAEHFHLEIPLRDLLEAPTIAGIAAIIERRLLEEEDEQTLASMLDEMEAMEDKDVLRLMGGARTDMMSGAGDSRRNANHTNT